MHARLTSEFIRRIPKTDLHVHLDGSLRLSTLIELAREARVELPSYEASGLRETVFKDHYESLPDYLKGFAYTVAVMQDPECVERIAYELAQDNLAEGVRYVEVRFAPQLHIRDDFSIKDVVGAVCRGMDRAKKEHNVSEAVQEGLDIEFEYGVIVCALRCFHAGMSDYYAKLFAVLPSAPIKRIFAAASLELARASTILAHEHGLPVVGFDLAGEESGYPAVDHKDAYQFAHSNFIRKTVHAGEAYGPESIFQAITQCYANRIGHGTFLFHADRVVDPDIVDKEAYSENLAQYIASQRITLEVCLTSNLQTTPSIKNVFDHPVRNMIDHKLSVSICTDNRLVSNTTVSNELERVAGQIPLRRREFRDLVVAGFKGSFYPGKYIDKRAYVRKALNVYQNLEKSLLEPEEPR